MLYRLSYEAAREQIGVIEIMNRGICTKILSLLFHRCYAVPLLYLRMDVRLGLRLELTQTTKNEHGKFKSNCTIREDVAKKTKNKKRSRWEKKGITFLMKIPVKSAKAEFKSFLTSIAKL